MSHNAYTVVNPRKKAKEKVLPKQSKKLKDQVRNSDGAAVWKLDDFDRLGRFLILGSEGGSYYASEKKLTKENGKCISRLLKAGKGLEVVQKIVEVSDEGKAPKNDPALFALAMCAGLGDDETKTAALDALPKVARFGTHLFHFVEFVLQFRGWGRSLRKAIANWYSEKEVGKLEFDTQKYKARDGWSHQDLLRLSHVKPKNDAYRLLYLFVTNEEKFHETVSDEDFKAQLPFVYASESLKGLEKSKDIVKIVKAHRLPMEVVPTEKRSKAIYEVMLDNYGITALIRNLGNLTKQEVLSKMELDAVRTVVARLTNEEQLKRGRVHPLSVLNALKTYGSGRGFRGGNAWIPVQRIVDALDDSFYLCFKNIEPTGKRIMLALDVSGSMEGNMIAGMNIDARTASGALAMATIRTEKDVVVTAFSGGNRGGWGGHVVTDNPVLTELDLSPKLRLDSVINEISDLPFDSTDCSLPMRWALKKNLKVDAFVIYTDSETNAYGSIQPHAALKQYRDKMGIPDAKMIVVGMCSNGFSIANPEDRHSLDVVGFSTDCPTIINDFIRGDI